MSGDEAALRAGLLYRFASVVEAYVETAETGVLHAAGVDGWCCWQVFDDAEGRSWVHRLCGPEVYGQPCRHAHHFTELLLAHGFTEVLLPER